ncbi:MAG: hypothetical protein ABJB66_16555 [Gemmatimonadaceae bacterium]
MLSSDRKKIWVHPRLQATCWDDRWLNEITGYVFYETTYSSQVLAGDVVDVKPKAELDMDDGSETSHDALEFRRPGSVTFSAANSTVDFGSPICDLKVDGVTASSSCSSYTSTSWSAGSHTVALHVTDEAGNEAIATGFITVHDECPVASDTTYATLRTNPDVYTVPHGTTSLITPCGQVTTPGSGGGSAPVYPSNDESCHWERYFWSETFEGVTIWDWIGPWDYVCGYATLRAPSSLVQSAATATGPLHVRVVATSRMGNGPKIRLERSSGFDAVVTVDTATTSPKDLAAALGAVEQFTKKLSSHGKNVAGAVLGGVNTELTVSAADYDAAQNALKTLGKGGKTRLDVTVDRKHP